MPAFDDADVGAQLKSQGAFGQSAPTGGFADPSSVNGTPQIVSPTTNQSLGRAMAYGLPGIGIGMVDTFGHSLGLWGNDTVKETLQHISPGGMGDFYAQNRTPLRIGGEIVGVVIPGKIASEVLKSSRLLREAGTFGKVIQESRAVNWLLGSSTELAEREAAVKAAAQVSADNFGVFSGRTFAVPAVDAAKRGYYAARVVESVRQTAAFEAGFRTLYNDSELFNPADQSYYDQAAWGVAGLAGAAGLDIAVGRLAVRKLIQGVGRNAIPASEYAKTISDAVFMAGDRGVGVTQFAAMAEDLKNLSKGGSAELVSNLSQDQTVIKKVLTKQLGEMAGDSHPILGRAALTDEQSELGLRALSKNQTSFLYTTKLAQMPEAGATEFFVGLEETANKAKKSYERQATGILSDKTMKPDVKAEKLAALRDERDPILGAASEQHYVIESTGDWSVYRTRADNWLDTNSFGSIKRNTFKEPFGTAQGELKEVTKASLSANVGGADLKLFEDSFRWELPKEMSTEQYSAAHAMASKFVKNWKPTEWQQYVLSDRLPWMTVEGILNLRKAHPALDQTIQFAGKIKSVADAEFYVLDSKFKQFDKWMSITERQPKTAVGKALRDKQKVDPADVIARLNLPTMSGGQTHPVVELFAQARMQGARSLREIFENPNKLSTDTSSIMDVVQGALREAGGTSKAIDPATGKMVVYETSGKLFRQNDTRPIFVASANVPQLTRNDAVIQALVQTKRDLMIERLGSIDPAVAPIVATTIGDVVGTGAMGPAKNVLSLHDGEVSGRGILTPQDRVNEQVEALKAMQLLAQASDKRITQMIGVMMKERLEPLTGKLFSGKNLKTHLVDFNRVEQSYRYGWDIQGVEFQNGLARFLLDPKSVRNEQLARKFFGDAAVDEDGALAISHMPDMSVTALKNKKPSTLMVSELAGQTADAISSLSIQSGKEVNALRVALGQHAISLRNFHLPTPELSRDGAWFLRNSKGNVVATYSSGTAGQNKSRALEAAGKLEKFFGEQHVAVPIDDVRREHSIYDDTFFDVIDYSDQLAKSGAAISGSFAKAEIDTTPETLKAMITSLNDQFLSAGIRARAAVFSPQLNYAKQAGELLGKNALKESNIFERYQALVFSRSPQAPKGFLAAGYNAVESSLDNALSVVNSFYSEAIASTEAGKAGARSLRQVVRRQTSETEFQQYHSKAGSWSPFQNVEDWLASTHPEIPRLTARSSLAKLSLVSSTMSLRFLEVGTALLNLSGVVSTAPAIVFSMRKLAGESFGEHVARTAAWSSRASSADIATFSPMKALTNSIGSYWRGELAAPMERAAELGYFEPEYAALAKVLTDPKAGGKGNLERWVDKASYLADRSEILSRKMAWGMGYKIGKDLHKFDDERNAFIYANNFMNEMIGNYNPRNKPGMFQGAVGLPLGAFQTYMFNFYRRMYGYLERGDKQAMVAAYGAQASMFGAASVPGWSAFNGYLFDNYDGSDNIATRLDRKLPPGVSELLLHGSLSSIPAIFGAGGIALYPRGSVDVTQPVPSFLDAGRAPPIQFLANVAQGVQRTVDNFMTAGGFSTQKQEEILANFSTNRALKSIMEFAANAKTDRTGQVIENSTRDAIHVAAALVGAVPSATRRIQDSYNSQQLVERQQAALRSKLTDKTRSLIRGGNFDVTDFQDMAQDYIRSGGNPAYFGLWLRNTTETAVEPKSIKKLQELAGGERWIEFLNMLAAMQQNVPTGAQQ